MVGETDPFPDGHEWNIAASTPVVEPAVALLLVHPWIEAEARDVLYGGNLWLMLNGPQTPAHSFLLHCHRNQFRRIRIVFSLHDLITRDWIQETPDRSKGMEGSRLQRTDQLHNALAKDLDIEWGLRIALLMSTPFLLLDYLEMDLDQCYCPIGCCRAVDVIIFWMLRISIGGSTCDLDRRLPCHVRVTGFKSVDEKRQFYEMLHMITFYNASEAKAMLTEVHVKLHELEG